MPLSPADAALLLRRSGFGATPSEIAALTPLTWEQAVDTVLDTSANPSPSVGLPDLSEDRGWWKRYTDMVGFWTDRAATMPNPVSEKMVLFWHGLLCSSLDKVHKHHLMFRQNQVFRYDGMGNWRTLLHRIALDPAMLIYLDNDDNVAESPNENWARELLELFMLGAEHVDQADVVESARAWTGHGLTEDLRYVFNPEDYDASDKTVFGVRRNWYGPELIDHVLDHTELRVLAARFLARRLWSFFAHPDPSDSLIDALAAVAISNDFEIRPLLRSIFLRPEFRSDTTRTGLVREPFDYVVSAMRQLGVTSAEARPQNTLGDMGQALFKPPNVAGWKQNDYWISSANTWGKWHFASDLRWALYKRGDLEGIDSLSADGSARAALAHFGITDPQPTTVTALTGLIEGHRANDRWAERASALMFPLLTPDFQMA